MDAIVMKALIGCETNIEGALSMLSGDETLYLQLLKGFLSDQTMQDLDNALESQAWDDAFTAAHALKGLAGNMGFVPLFHTTSKLVVLIRGGRLNEINAAYRDVKKTYQEITEAIRGILQLARYNGR